MGKRGKYSDELKERCRQLHGRGRSLQDIQRLLKSEGIDPPPSIGWLHNTVNSTPATVPQVVGAGLARRVACAGESLGGEGGAPLCDDTAPAPQDAPTPAPGELLPVLIGQLDALKGMAVEAQRDGNVTGFSNIQRTLNQTIALIDKLTPPLPPSVEDAPDMVAAAARGRAKLAEYVEKIRLGKS